MSLVNLETLKDNVSTLSTLIRDKVVKEHQKFSYEASALDLESRTAIDKQIMALYSSDQRYKDIVDNLAELEANLASLKVTVPNMLRIAELEHEKI